MNSEIQELERRLDQARKKEKVEILMEQIKHYKNKYLDKCYSSKTLTKNTGRIDATIIHIYDVIPDLSDCKYNGKSIDDIDLYNTNFNEYSVVLKFESINYTIGVDNEIKLISSHSFMSADHLNIPRYEISLERFNDIQKTVQMKAMNGGTAILEGVGNWDLLYSNYYPDEINKVNILESQGFKFIHLESMEVVNELRNHPFLYGRYLMVTLQSHKIIKEMIDGIENDINNLCVSPHSDNMVSMLNRRVNLLKSALELIKNEL